MLAFYMLDGQIVISYFKSELLKKMSSNRIVSFLKFLLEK